MKKKLFSSLVVLTMLFSLLGTVNAAKIKFYAEKNDDQKIGEMDVKKNDGAKLITIADPEKNGFRFIGWSTDNEKITLDNVNKTISVDEPLGGPDKEKVYATWSTLYNITYDLDGGVALGNPSLYTELDEITLNAPTKEGYEFLGWIDEQGVNLGIEYTIEEGTTGDITFIAAWKKNIVEEQVSQTVAEVKNPNTAINSSVYVILMIIGLASFVILNVVNFKKNENN